MGYMPGCNKRNCNNRYNACRRCESKMAELEREARDNDGWSPRTVGSIDGNDVTFRQGRGINEGHTLIADGQSSGRSFDRRGEHNHYGPKREGGGRVEDDGGDRGYYTGPGR